MSGASAPSANRFLIELVDKKIDDDLWHFRQSRFFNEFDREVAAKSLGARLANGDLSGGSGSARAKGLAWCARSLARSPELEIAKQLVSQAQSLGSCTEIEIAAAFIVEADGGEAPALARLATINLPIARTASLLVATNKKPPQRAAEWLNETGITVNDLDSDGKCHLLSHMLAAHDWAGAQQVAKSITEADLSNTPVLAHVLGMVHLLSAVPPEFRDVVRSQIPFEAESFPLISDPAELESRRLAQRLFLQAATAANQLSCPKAENVNSDYALWLELRDPETSSQGRQHLEAGLRDPSSSLRLAVMALRFGLKLDVQSLERQIDQETALHGQLTRDGAITRFALAFTRASPEDVANYIAKHRDGLALHLDVNTLWRLEFEMLARAKLFERAKEALARLEERGLTEGERGKLERILAEAQGGNPVELKKQQFERTGDLNDLFILVEELGPTGNWEELCHYGEQLFNRTHTLSSAITFANALHNGGRDESLYQLLIRNQGILKQSNHLKLLYCWALYRRGDLLKSKSQLSALAVETDDANYRALKINIAVGTGDWNVLPSLLPSDASAMTKLNAKELIAAAQLAVPLGAAQAKELLYAAAKQSEGDPAKLAACYFLASQAGWEDDDGVHEWLEKAAALSKDDGPLQRVSIQDLLERKPEWDRRESATLEQYTHGDIPMFVTAQLLNRSVVELMLTTGYANLVEKDPRRRAIVPAYSGKRVPIPVDNTKAAGIDPTALLTLSLLGLLDKALDAFPAVLLPHSTLSWLFQEKQKATFHQPTRIKTAHLIRNLLARGSLEKFSPNATTNSELAAQVGPQLAEMIAEAELDRKDEATQRLVVRSYPVHRIGSLMEESADLTQHYEALVSCQSVVEKVRRLGGITSEEEKRALAYLKLHERRWPSEPSIQDNAILYLDDLSLNYLEHAGILERLRKTGFRAIISHRSVKEADAFISYEGISAQVASAIEAVRKTLHIRILNGTATIANQTDLGEADEKDMWRNPTYSAIALANQCSAIISDDRFVNQHPRVDLNGANAAVYSTLDVINSLLSAHSLTTDEWLNARTRLRQAGFQFFAATPDEIQRHLQESAISGSRLIESAELRAIRESLALARMTKWVQLPREEPYLDLTVQALLIALRRTWESAAPLEDIVARADWILEQADIRGWAHRLDSSAAMNLVGSGYVRFLKLLLDARPDKAAALQQSYWDWIEERIFSSLRENAPDVFSTLLSDYKGKIKGLTEMDLSDGSKEKRKRSAKGK